MVHQVLSIIRMAFIGVLSLLVLCEVGNAQNRVALVIGNSDYENVAVLKNPINDANLIAESLLVAGFEMKKILNADSTTIKKAMAILSD